jgi:hypothetical protein
MTKSSASSANANSAATLQAMQEQMAEIMKALAALTARMDETTVQQAQAQPQPQPQQQPHQQEPVATPLPTAPPQLQAPMTQPPPAGSMSPGGQQQPTTHAAPQGNPGGQATQAAPTHSVWDHSDDMEYEDDEAFSLASDQSTHPGSLLAGALDQLSVNPAELTPQQDMLLGGHFTRSATRSLGEPFAGSKEPWVRENGRTWQTIQYICDHRRLAPEQKVHLVRVITEQQWAILDTQAQYGKEIAQLLKDGLFNVSNPIQVREPIKELLRDQNKRPKTTVKTN